MNQAKWLAAGVVVCGGCALVLGMVGYFSGPRSGSTGAHLTLHLRDHESCVVQSKAAIPTREDSDLENRLDRAYGKLPLSFEPNVGQTISRVKFLARGAGYTLYLTGDEVVFSFKGPTDESRRAKQNRFLSEVSRPLSAASGPHALTPSLDLTTMPLLQSPSLNRAMDQWLPGSVSSDEQRPTVNRIGLKFVNANRNGKMIGVEQLPGQSNYFVGRTTKNWRTSVPMFAKVKFEKIYPGIDLHFYSNPAPAGELEYDFVISPGADPRQIRLAVETTTKIETRNSKLGNQLRVDPGGNLVVSTGDQQIRFQKPVVYQRESTVDSPQSTGRTDDGLKTASASHSSLDTRHFVEGRYALFGGNQVGFEVGDYDRSLPLIIDPVLDYSTYLGGSNYDDAYGIAVDASGNAYVTGQTDSLDFPTQGPVQGLTSGNCRDPLGSQFPCYDAFVAKLNASGSALVYSTFLGGGGDDRATGIAVDSQGNAYVTGITVSTDFPTINGIQPNFSGGMCGPGTPCWDSFVAKLNPAGSALVYSSYLGGTGNDLASGIAVDGSGAAYVVGSTSSTNFPVSADAIQTVHGGGLYNAFVTKLNSNGSSVAYSTYLGGDTEDHGAAIAVDPAGEAMITGYTNSNNFPTQNALRPARGGGTCGSAPCFDAFVGKLNAAGTGLVYSTYFGGSGGDYGYGIATDAAGNAYVTGLTTSTNLPVTEGALKTSGSGTSYDAYVIKLNTDGSALVYSTYLGGLSSEWGYAIAADAAGNAYVTGYTYGKGFPIASPLQGSPSFMNDAFVAKLNSTGSALIFSTYLGGTGNDVGSGIAVDPAGKAFVAGGTFSADFPVTSAAFQQTYGGGGNNAFVAKISALQLPVTRLSQSNIVFPDQPVEISSSPISVVLTNQGDATLSVSSVTATGDYNVTHDCGDGLLPFANCTLSITFTPKDLGPRFGSVSIEDNAWGSPHLINLAGNGVAAPQAFLTPTSLSFGAQLLGTTSAPQVVTLTNTGLSTLAISNITVIGDFSQSNDCPASLPSSSSCSIRVSFSPTSKGPRKSFISVSHNAPGNPSITILTGTGTAAGLSPQSVNFPNQNVGATSLPVSITLTNAGNAPMHVFQVAIHGADAADFPMTTNCFGILAPGGNCAASVAFKASKLGAESASLMVSDDGGGSPHAVPLSGNGVAGSGTNLSKSASKSSVQFTGFPRQPLQIAPGQLPRGQVVQWCDLQPEDKSSDDETETPSVARKQPDVQLRYLPKLKENRDHGNAPTGYRTTRRE